MPTFTIIEHLNVFENIFFSILVSFIYFAFDTLIFQADKETFRTRSFVGMRWCERAWTVVATCARGKHSVYDFFVDALNATYAGTPYPRLIPAKLWMVTNFVNSHTQKMLLSELGKPSSSKCNERVDGACWYFNDYGILQPGGQRPSEKNSKSNRSLSFQLCCWTQRLKTEWRSGSIWGSNKVESFFWTWGKYL